MGSAVVVACDCGGFVLVMVDNVCMVGACVVMVMFSGYVLRKHDR